MYAAQHRRDATVLVLYSFIVAGYDLLALWRRRRELEVKRAWAT